MRVDNFASIQPQLRQEIELQFEEMHLVLPPVPYAVRSDDAPLVFCCNRRMTPITKGAASTFRAF
jgi:hypothetical protein